MWASILPVISPVLLCAALGFLWHRAGQAFPSEFVGRLVLWVGAPSLIIGTLGTVPLDSAAFTAVIRASLVLLVVTGLLVLAACTVLRLPLRNYAAPLLFGNSGNMGLPLCLFAFGQEGLALSLGVFVVTSVTHFSVGVSLFSGRAAIKPLLQSPIVWAGAIALTMMITDWQLPKTLSNTLGILGGMAIPLMLLTLGASLDELKWRDSRSTVGLGLLRLVVGISGGVLTVWLLDLHGLLRGVVLLQSATPSAVFNYLLAAQYRRQPARVAGLVMASTVMSFVSIPLLLVYLGR